MKKILSTVFVAAFCVYAAYSFVAMQYEISGKNRELEELESKVDEQKLENAKLESVLKGDNRRAYIEEIARKKLGYAYEDEIFFIDINGK